jgi:uroporphyrinogen decarboxylase
MIFTIKIMIKNDLLLKALNGDPCDRPPVWMMRQAGRYLPEFMKLKNKYDFFTRCQTPELATKITLMPIKELNPDAAIIFSDILVVLQAMGIKVEMKNNFGPYIPEPIKTKKQIEKIIVPNIEESLGYVLEAIKLTKKELNSSIPLIGFAGAPWTLFCYAVEGSGSKNFNVAKEFIFKNPEISHKFLQKITNTTIEYLKSKINSGADVIQIFDSWGGVLSQKDYYLFSWNYIKQIIDSIKDSTHTIIFAKGCWYAIKEMSLSGASAIGLDWTCSAKYAKSQSNNNITFQGNYDPARLLSPIPKIKDDVKKMIKEFGTKNYIVNLGHGILPNIPVSHAKAFIESVKEFNT